MSTRGCIAFGTKDKWTGIYQHSDSYPTYLGQNLLAAYQAGELKADIVQKHPGGFSQYPDICYCHDEYFAKRDGSSAKDSPYYSKDARNGVMTQKNASPLRIEWVYVFDIQAGVMHILAGKQLENIPKNFPTKFKKDEYEKDYFHYGVHYCLYSVGKVILYYHKYMTAVALDAKPDLVDWEAIDQMRYPDEE